MSSRNAPTSLAPSCCLRPLDRMGIDPILYAQPSDGLHLLTRAQLTGQDLRRDAAGDLEVK